MWKALGRSTRCKKERAAMSGMDTSIASTPAPVVWLVGESSNRHLLATFAPVVLSCHRKLIDPELALREKRKDPTILARCRRWVKNRLVSLRTRRMVWVRSR